MTWLILILALVLVWVACALGFILFCALWRIAVLGVILLISVMRVLFSGLAWLLARSQTR